MRKILIALLIAFAVVLTALAAGLAFLHTTHGKVWLAQIISERIPGVSFSSIGGNLPGNVIIGRLEMSDKEGVWLEADRFQFTWHPLAMLRGKLRIGAVEVSRLRLLRLPAANENSSSSTIPDFAMDSFSIGELVLEPPLIQQQMTLRLAGKNIVSDLQVISGQIGSVYGPYHLNGAGHINPREKNFKAALALEALQLKSLFPDSNQQGTVTATLAAAGDFDKFSTETKIEVGLPDGGAKLVARGDVLSADKKFEGSVHGTLSQGRGQFILDASLKASPELIQVSPFSITGEGMTLSGNANWLVDKQQGDLSAKAGGTIGGQAFALDAGVHAIRNGQESELTVHKLLGNVEDHNFRLRDPAHVHIRDAGLELSSAAFSLDNGSLILKGSLASGEVNAKLMANDIALESLPVAGIPAGNLDTQLTLSGPLAKPVAKLTGQGKVRGDVPLSFNVRGDWQADKLHLSMTASARDARVTADANLRASFSLSPMQIDLSSKTPVDGKLLVDAPLNELNSLLYAKGIKVAGKIDGSATIDGTLGLPVVDGRFALKEGRLDHQESGVCVRGAQGDVILAGREVRIQDFSAPSPHGSLTAHGTLELGDSWPLSLAADFSHFRLFCGGLAKGEIDGQLNASGTMNDATLSGKLTLGPLNVQLPGNTPGKIDIPQVQTIFVDQKSSAELTAVQPWKLDIALKAPGRVFVRGRGLDAEFSGALSVQGSTDQPLFNGALTAHRGRFTLLGSELRLNQASLRFNGTIPPSPYLDVSAESTAQGTSIQVYLRGQAQKPEFTFSSTPALPRDEILALLLFGRSLPSLTPFQAIQLAQSAAELTGKRSGPGALGTLRSKLGVDRLDVGTGTDNSVTVGAGKYISDKVYVGISQGATPADRAVTTEIELTPHISATNSVDAEGNQGVGVQWKYDY